MGVELTDFRNQKKKHQKWQTGTLEFVAASATWLPQSSPTLFHVLPTRRTPRKPVPGFLPSILCFFVPIVNIYIGAKTRSDTREKFGISGSFIGDCCCFLMCPCCMMVQNQSQLDGVSMGENIERV